MSITTDNSKQFSVGTQWMIKDLTTETGKKFNGKTCVIVSTFDVSSGRVGVRIKNAGNKGRTLNIKPINLHAEQSTTLMEGQQEKGVKETIPQEQKPKIDENQRILDLLNSKEASLNTPPLPPQPEATQVASAASAPINPRTGLTNVETALLSPGEQAIRLKQRA